MRYYRYNVTHARAYAGADAYLFSREHVRAHISTRVQAKAHSRVISRNCTPSCRRGYAFSKKSLIRCWTWKF